jgi:hypothetical protein
MAARPFGDENVAIGEDEDLPRNLEVGGDRHDLETGWNGRKLAVPSCRLGDFHRWDERLVDIRQARAGARLVEFFIAFAAAGERGR